jgi:hypothetical protein
MRSLPMTLEQHHRDPATEPEAVAKGGQRARDTNINPTRS